MKKFMLLYATVFAGIWIGYGMYAVITNQPSASTVLVYGIGYSVVVFAASMFSYWLMKHYKKVDAMAKQMGNKKMRRVKE